MRQHLHLLIVLTLFIFELSWGTVANAQLVWKKQTHNFGIVQLNVPMTYEFKFANISNQALAIQFVKSENPYVTPYWEKTSVAAGAYGSVRLTYTAEKHAAFKAMVLVYFNHSSKPYSLMIQGKTERDDLADLFSSTETATANDIQAEYQYESESENLTPSTTTTPPSHPPTTPPSQVQQYTPPTRPPSTMPNTSTTTSTSPPTNTADISQPTIPTHQNTTYTMPIPDERPTPPPTKPSKRNKPPIKPKRTTTASSNNSTTIAAHYQGNATLNTAHAAAYLTAREKAMIKEINLIRSNPQSYVTVVQAYITYLENQISSFPSNKDMYQDEITTAKELIEELNGLSPLSILQPHQNIYKAAKRHGDAGKRLGNIEHESQDGSLPWDRITRYAPDMQHGNENLVGGPKDIRRSVLLLLVDSGIRGRGHRKTLLNHKWTHIACYEVGMVGQMPNFWIQKFGQAKNSTTTSATPPSTTQNPPMSYNSNTNKPVIITQPSAKPPKKTTQPKKSKRPKKNLPPPPNKPKSIASTRIASMKTEIAPKFQAKPTLNTGKNERYLTEREKAMITEINLIRSSPKAYIEVVKAYIDFMEKEIANNPSASFFYEKDLTAARELTWLMERLPSMTILKPHQGIYKSAKIHGDFSKNNGKIARQSTDGSMPWDRLRKYASEMLDGNENLISGPKDIRKAVLSLLINGTDNKRESRKTLLNPKWTHIACYEVGTIGTMPNYWIQGFGQLNPDGPSPPTTPQANFDLKPPPTKPTLAPPPPKPRAVPSRPSRPKRTMPTERLLDTKIAASIQGSASLNTAKFVDYMNAMEKAMLKEINLIRSSPDEYSQVVEAYIKIMEREIAADPSTQLFYESQIKNGRKLVETLKNASFAAILKPHKGLYKAAKIHGEEGKRRNNLENIGVDGSTAWERIKRHAPKMQQGDGNLVEGEVKVRKSMLLLLLENEQHFQNIMNPKWTHAACHEVGEVGNATYYWIQKFGQIATKSPKKNRSNRPETRVAPGRSALPSTADDNTLGFAHVPNTTTAIAPNIQTAAPHFSEHPTFKRLSNREQMMIQEINFLRANPRSYTEIVEAYIIFLKKQVQQTPNRTDFYQQKIKIAQELKLDLAKIPTLPLLQPHQQLYEVAKTHGLDVQNMATLSHIGSDGSKPWTRLSATVPDLKDGNEALLSEVKDIRIGVLDLLIDEHIADRAHRKMLLNPHWKYIGCYEIGRVGNRSNCWVQTFGL